MATNSLNQGRNNPAHGQTDGKSNKKKYGKTAQPDPKQAQDLESSTEKEDDRSTNMINANKEIGALKKDVPNGNVNISK